MQDEQQALLAKAARAATNALGGLAAALGAGAAQGLLQNRLARPWSETRPARVVYARGCAWRRRRGQVWFDAEALNAHGSHVFQESEGTSDPRDD
jgi:hypothetical protein